MVPFLTERKTSKEEKHQAALLFIHFMLELEEVLLQQETLRINTQQQGPGKGVEEGGDSFHISGDVHGTTTPLHHIQLLLLHMSVFSCLTPLMRLYLRRLLMGDTKLRHSLTFQTLTIFCLNLENKSLLTVNHVRNSVFVLLMM